MLIETLNARASWLTREACAGENINFALLPTQTAHPAHFDHDSQNGKQVPHLRNSWTNPQKREFVKAEDLNNNDEDHESPMKGYNLLLNYFCVRLR